MENTWKTILTSQYAWILGFVYMSNIFMKNVLTDWGSSYFMQVSTLERIFYKLFYEKMFFFYKSYSLKYSYI